MKRNVVLTGDRPTGPLHLGHYVGSLRNRVELQETCEQFIMLADIQALTDNMDRIALVQDSIVEVVLDYLAVGIDPAKTVVFVQSAVPALTELTVHLLNITSFERVRRNPTVKQEIQERNYGESTTAGFVIYPVSQAADILAFKTDIVPVGADQQPMIELANETARRFNRLFNAAVFKECVGMIPDVGRLPGTDGKAKMGKSLKNAIYLGDPEEVVLEKIKQMYTDPTHLRVEDPGHLEGNVVFTYLDVFDDDAAGVAALKERYMRGGLADSVVKRRLRDVLVEVLRPMRQRRIEYAADREYVVQVLREGTAKARAVAEDTLAQVRDAMGIDYFMGQLNGRTSSVL
ncbi:MAG: tryptophan--tRNA ligase [Gemmatimonadaceae bacterium]|nr:tryptophan--tRNA ligase [Gemmatimonadaceae bacterium]